MPSAAARASRRSSTVSMPVSGAPRASMRTVSAVMPVTAVWKWMLRQVRASGGTGSGSGQNSRTKPATSCTGAPSGSRKSGRGKGCAQAAVRASPAKAITILLPSRPGVMPHGPLLRRPAASRAANRPVCAR